MASISQKNYVNMYILKQCVRIHAYHNFYIEYSHKNRQKQEDKTLLIGWKMKYHHHIVAYFFTTYFSIYSIV